LLSPKVPGWALQEGRRAVFEEFWPDLGKAVAAGLLVGGASVAVQWAAHKMVRPMQALRVRRRRGGNGPAAVERRLAAILAADFVGYSRLMEVDEEGTHGRLLAHRREVIEPSIRQHRGRIVKNTGDGVLVEFVSVVDAMRCALQTQEAMLARNVGLPQNRRIDLRMAVNLGDVIVEPEDIYGHAVNLAARLESLAAPGGICISADTWRYVRGVIATEFVDLGEQPLKNIADPVHVFAVAPDL
jgi:adenylate cyclase